MYKQRPVKQLEASKLLFSFRDDGQRTGGGRLHHLLLAGHWVLFSDLGGLRVVSCFLQKWNSRETSLRIVAELESQSIC